MPVKKSKRQTKLGWFNKRAMPKWILAIVAAGSFLLAFGQEYLGQISVPIGQNRGCLSQFYLDTPPVLDRQSLEQDSYALCFNGFNVMYSGLSKTPLWSAEHLTFERLSQKIKRVDNFHEESKIQNPSHRSTLADYRASGYDRGHMAPNADMADTNSQFDSFSLANMVPQAPKNNQQVWRELEEATRALVMKQKNELYVVTGPVFEGKKLKTIGNGVIVPTAIYKAIYQPRTGAIGVYYAPNDNSLRVKVVSVCYLEEKLGINLFPQLTEAQKRNVYALPLTARDVKAKTVLTRNYWDAQSQCIDTVPEQVQATQRQFSKTRQLPEISQLSIDPKQIDFKFWLNWLNQQFSQNGH